MINRKLGGGQRYGLAIQRGIKVDRVTIACIRERLTQ